MRNRDLHDGLREYALDAAALLSGDLAAGAEIPFDVREQNGRGPVLYDYRPQTEPFIAQRARALCSLPTHRSAAEALIAAAAHPAGEGAPRVDPEPALQALLERLWEDATTFEFPEQRFEAVYAEVEDLVYRKATRARIVVPIFGPRLEPVRIRLDDELELLRPEIADLPSEARWTSAGDGDSGPAMFCVFDRRLADGEALPVDQARERFEVLERALKLLGLGPVAIGPLGWVSADDGDWRAVGVANGGAAVGEPWTIYDSDEPGLCELLDAVATHGGADSPFGWALERFMSAGLRPDRCQALSDHLLALRALLDAGGDAGRTTLPLRVAALCAERTDRPSVQHQVELALALERRVIAGGDGEAFAREAAFEDAGALVRGIEGHVRSLLRDVLCGYLQPDLRAIADEILLQGSAPIEIEARDTRPTLSGTGGSGGETVEFSALERAELDLAERVLEIPGPRPVPDPGPVPVPEPGPLPTPDPGPVPTPDPGPSPVPDPVREPEPDPVPEPVPDEDPDLEPVADADFDREPVHDADADYYLEPDYAPDYKAADYRPQGFTVASSYDFDEDAESYAAPA